MFTRLAIPLFFLASALGLFIALIPADAASLTVGGSNPNYTTIQSAINAASSGDNVIVLSGTYDERLYINKTVDIQGLGSLTVIRPSSAPSAGVYDVEFAPGSNGSRIYNFVLDFNGPSNNLAGNGIIVRDRDVRIDSNPYIYVGAGSMGIYAPEGYNVSGLNISRNSIYGDPASRGVGVRVSSDSAGSSIISGNSFNSTSYALFLGRTEYSVVNFSHSMVDNTFTGSLIDMHIGHGSDVSSYSGLSGIVWSTNSSIGEVLSLASGGDTLIVQPGTYAEGISVTRWINITGNGSVVVQPTGGTSGYDVSFLDGSGGSVIQNLTLDFNGASDDRSGNGISVGQSGEAVGNVKVMGNVIYAGEGRTAVTSVSNSGIDGLVLSGNTIHADSTSGSSGIRINDNYDSGRVNVLWNTIQGRVLSGIVLEADDVNVTGNVVESGSSDGVAGINVTPGSIEGVGSNRLDFYNNTVRNFMYGILYGSVSNSSQTEHYFITSNYLTNNSVGLRGLYGANSTMRGNRVVGNSDAVQSLFQFNATRNFWGSSSGPNHTLAQNGTYNVVSQNATVVHWCLSSACSNFQNNLPVAPAPIISVVEDTATVISLSASDSDGDAYTMPLVGTQGTSGVSIGTLTQINSTAYLYTPESNYNGVGDGFTYRACDDVNSGDPCGSVSQITLNVTVVNDAPTTPSLSTVNNTIFNSTSHPLSWSASTDVDSSPLTYYVLVSNSATFSSTASQGTTNSTSFSPPQLGAGRYYWKVLASDGQINSTSQTRSFIVSNSTSVQTSSTSSNTLNIVNSTSSMVLGVNTTSGSPSVFTASVAEPSSNVGLVGLGKFFDISVSDESFVSFPIYLNISYTDAELSSAGVSESSLSVQFFNVTSNQWESVSGSQVDAVNNVVYAPLTHLSIYGVYGSQPAASSSGGSSSGFGGSISTGGGSVVAEPPAPSLLTKPQRASPKDDTKKESPQDETSPAEPSEKKSNDQGNLITGLFIGSGLGGESGTVLAIIVGVAIVAAGAFLVVMRRKSASPSEPADLGQKL